MDEDKLYESPMNPKAAHAYLEKKGLIKSNAVEANSYAAQNSKKLSDLYKSYVGNDSKELWDEAIKKERTANAYSWMMIKTAIDEHMQGWLYIENGERYINSITDQGTKFTTEQWDNISLIRYFGNLYHKTLMTNRYLGDFRDGNLQFWYMKLHDLEKKGNGSYETTK